MQTVTSKDGTVIAFDKSGNGPPVILVSGALGVGSHAMFRAIWRTPLRPLAMRF